MLGLFAALLSAAMPVRAACTACTSFDQGIVLGTVTANGLTEASGVAASARNSGVLWAHNDGSRRRLFAFGLNGALLASFNLDEDVDDVEDIAVGPGPVSGASYLYVGDVGGNVGSAAARSEVKLFRIPEPAVELGWAAKPQSKDFEGVETFTLAYPEGSYDAETLLVDAVTGDILVVTKEKDAARIYRANLTGLIDQATVTMSFVRSIQFALASGGDISADGTQIALRREDAARLWARCDNEAIDDAFARAGQEIPVIGPPDEPNGEAIAFLREGVGYVTISEGDDPSIYFFRALCPVAPAFLMQPADVTLPVGGAATFETMAVGFPAPTYQWRLNGQLLSGQASASLQVENVTLADAGEYEITASNASGVVTSTATLTVRLKPDLRITEVQPNPANDANVDTADWWELTSFESQPVDLSGWRFNDDSGGSDDAYVFENGLIIRPGETIVLVDGLTPAEFRAWWGDNNLPPNLQIIRYSGGGLGLGANGDAVLFWSNLATDPNDTIASVTFGPADAGVTFNYDPVSDQFGAKSQLGINGVFRAQGSSDTGSPGRIIAPAVNPSLSARRVGELIRIEFDAGVGHRYLLETRNDFSGDTWTPTGDSYQATNNARAFFELESPGEHRFYRVVVQ